MALRVKEIMNPELLALRPGERTDQALMSLDALQVTGAAVVDEQGRPLGVISLRDLMGGTGGKTVENRMTSPALVVRVDAAIQEAARLIGETGYRRLVVVDGTGCAVGMVSAVDVIRGLIGLPAEHPASFPHLDRKTGLNWTDEEKLDMEKVEFAPPGPGLFTLIYGKAGLPETVVWVESCYNVRSRLISLLSIPEENPQLNIFLQHPEHLRFRAASVADEGLRKRLLEKLESELPRGPSLAPKA
jgi:CBS domain-containing protein